MYELYIQLHDTECGVQLQNSTDSSQNRELGAQQQLKEPVEHLKKRWDQSSDGCWKAGWV